MSKSLLNRRALIVAALLFAVAVAALLLIGPGKRGAGNDSTDPSSGKNVTVADAATGTAAAAPDAMSEEEKREAVESRLQTALDALKATDDPAETRTILTELRAFLDGQPRAIVAAALAGHLDAGDDAGTGLPFKITPTGFLETGGPTFRVTLLDWLGHFDPVAAGLYAEKILATPTHADEWALSFRNYARAHPTPDSFPFLIEKVEAMLDNDAWRAAPSAGFLEAFDVFVYTRNIDSTPRLAKLVSDKTSENRSLTHASFLTLDRLTLAAPQEMFEQLASRSELHEARGEMVSNFFARADVREPAQRAAVESWLLDPARTPSQLNSFAGVYPNMNMMISHNLLTGNMTPTRDNIVAHDREALEIVTGWLDDPRFESVRPHIQTMHNRLATFVRQAQGGN